MAAALASNMFGDAIWAESAGVEAYGGAASREAVEIMRDQFGLDLSNHVPRSVAAASLDTFHCIVAMEPNIAEDLSSRFSAPSGRIIVWDVADPLDRGIPAYERCVEQLTRRLTELQAVFEMLAALSDLFALLYHEARNVRHLVREKHASEEEYRALISLPTNRNKAWAQLQTVRRDARDAKEVSGIRRVFEVRFGLGLPDLVDLFGNPGWRHSGLGGNQWASIALAVGDLSSELDGGNFDRARELLLQTMEMRHNNGIVRDKLRDLDSPLRQ